VTDSTQSYVDRYTEIRIRQLREIVEWLMLRYPHSKPHPETVEMFVCGLLAAIDVSNARTEAYKDEPWIGQDVECHVNHCVAHAWTARDATKQTHLWLADDGTPELAHAVVRGMMGLWQYAKEQSK
jgi:hypothetical protein